MPLRVPLLLEGEGLPRGLEAHSVDINPFGIQAETSAPVEVLGPVEVRPAAGVFAEAHPARGRIRWIKASGDYFRYGIAFDEVANWRIPLSCLVQGLCAHVTPHPFLQKLVDSLEDGLVLLDKDLRVIAINSRQPFCPVKRPAEHLGSPLKGMESMNIPFRGEKVRFKSLLLQAGQGREEIRFSAPIVPFGTAHERYYDISITPIQELGVLVVRTRDVTGLEELKRLKREKEEVFWLQYKYFTLGRLFDDLLEDIVNPLSAVVGRLDLLGLKMADAREPVGAEEVASWQADLSMAQSALDSIKEFCRAASRRRYRDARGSDAYFSISTLIEEELSTLELHHSFRKVKKTLNIAGNLPPIPGSYSDWANAFVALCQRIVQQAGTSAQKELTIAAALGNNHVELKITHNGKALSLPLEKEPSMAILELLKKKYGVSVYLAGGSGSQTITLKIPIGPKAH